MQSAILREPVFIKLLQFKNGDGQFSSGCYEDLVEAKSAAKVLAKLSVPHQSVWLDLGLTLDTELLSHRNVLSFYAEIIYMSTTQSPTVLGFEDAISGWSSITLRNSST